MSRLEKIASLSPVRCYIGKEAWHGYVVFEFKNAGRVVLECPIEGNATYVLSGDWKIMVNHTKAELRQEYANRYTRIVHKGAWLDRIRQALPCRLRLAVESGVPGIWHGRGRAARLVLESWQPHWNLVTPVTQ